MKSFRDPETDVLRAWGYVESNGEDRARDEPDDFNLEPGKWRWDGVAWVPHEPEPAPIKIFSVLEFRSRFTLEEQIAIRNASLVNHEVGLVYDAFLSAQYINLDDPAVEQGVALYVAKGLLAASRKAELLAPGRAD